MCSFITLAEPRPATVVSCATITAGTDYARCQRLTDQTDTDGPWTNRPTTAKGDEADRLDLLPTPTGWEEPATFGTAISAASNPAGQIDYRDERITVTITKDDENTPVKTTIRLPGAVIGVVPDDVTEVEIAGTVLPVTNNVWHFTSTTGQALDSAVRTADGKTAST